MNRRCQRLATKLGDEFDYGQHPPPASDGILNYTDDHYCGFDSLEALFNWFEQWLEELQEHDYHAAVFEVEDNDTLHGGKQVMFRRKKYRRKRALQLSEVRNETRRSIESVAEPT